MSVRTFTADQLPQVAREFTAGRTVIFVVAATDNVGWAATRTWEMARACASTERRVALIDLSLDRPALDLMAQNTTDEGIVDAFLYGVSLTHVARQQDVPSLYYVGVGTRTNEPAEVWASKRWDRLAKGFKNEKAVLITYIPPGALNRCALEADGMVVLAPDGYDPALDVAPGIARKLQQGTPLIGVVTAAAEITPEPTPQPPIPQEPEQEPERVWDVSAPDTPQTPVPPPAPDPEDSPLRVSIPVVRPTSKPPVTSEPIDTFDDLTPIDLTPFEQINESETVKETEAVIPPNPTAATETPAPVVPPEPEETAPVLPEVPDFDLEDDVDEVATPTPVPTGRVSSASIPETPYDGPPIFEPSRKKPIGNILFLVGGAVAVAAVVGGYMMWNGRGAAVEGTPTAEAAEPVPQDSILTQPAAVAPPLTLQPLTESDSLYYSVQAAALNTLEDAMEHGRGLQRGNRAITVSPVRIGGRIWYRVIVGAYPSPEAAVAGRASLWQDGLVENGDGTILRTPQAFSLGRRATIDSARVEAASLWSRGIPAYVLPHDGGGIVTIGAFVRPEQAAIAESILTAASLASTLAPRLGSTQ